MSVNLDKFIKKEKPKTKSKPVMMSKYFKINSKNQDKKCCKKKEDPLKKYMKNDDDKFNSIGFNKYQE